MAIVQTVQKQQLYDNSCGACSLICAAMELGIKEMPIVEHRLMGPSTNMPLDKTQKTEAAIYRITSGATLGASAHEPSSNGQWIFDLEKAGYSFPQNIAFAARLMGLKCSVYMENGIYSTFLSCFYSDVKKKLIGSGVKVYEAALPGLNPNQRALEIVGVIKFLGLHYVMHRPDGSYMDPADGDNFANFDAMNNSWSKCYKKTGISLLLERQ